MEPIEHESTIRLLSFAAVLTVMLIWETIASRRARAESRVRRGARNLALAAADTVLVRLLLPIVPVGFAGLSAEWGWGILHRLSVPGWLAVVVSVVALDFAIYLQHVLFHAVPALWRVHMVHHSDLEFDTTTGLRFHPVEIVLSLGVKLAVIAVLGPPVVAVMLFEILLNATSVFNHANVRIPVRADRWLRWLVVTPDMHRVHHSAERSETDSNFGFNLPWWDRLLGTYRDQPAAGHERMTIGLAHLRDPRGVTIGKLVTMPFRRDAGASSAHDARREPRSPGGLGREEGTNGPARGDSRVLHEA